MKNRLMTLGGLCALAVASSACNRVAPPPPNPGSAAGFVGKPAPMPKTSVASKPKATAATAPPKRSAAATTTATFFQPGQSAVPMVGGVWKNWTWDGSTGLSNGTTSLTFIYTATWPNGSSIWVWSQGGPAPGSPGFGRGGVTAYFVTSP
jgi:hypothetical protein